MDYTAKGRLRKISAEKDWPSIDELARYEEEGWNDPFFLEEESLDYENPDLKQLSGVMECKVGTLMEKAISLMRRSESFFGMSQVRPLGIISLSKYLSHHLQKLLALPFPDYVLPK
uniref:Uncharacterized protein n=1 Tax=Tanacetum cinerariifolium TaxID=118510 RepID=A0A699J1P5_TANCI|nr:hypothetical protein [Tanacetum cinerariifolium]